MTIKHFEIRFIDVFRDFNKRDIDDELFDEYYGNKRDLGKMVRETANLVSAKQVTKILLQKLEDSV